MSAYCIELCQKFQVSSVHQLTWSHGCNSREKLRAALNSDVHLIEADVMLGTYDDVDEPSKTTSTMGAFFSTSTTTRTRNPIPGGGDYDPSVEVLDAPMGSRAAPAVGSSSTRAIASSSISPRAAQTTTQQNPPRGGASGMGGSTHSALGDRTTYFSATGAGRIMGGAGSLSPVAALNRSRAQQNHMRSGEGSSENPVPGAPEDEVEQGNENETTTTGATSTSPRPPLPLPRTGSYTVGGSAPSNASSKAGDLIRRMSREESANEDPFLDNTAASAPAYVVQAVEPRTITELSSSGRRRPGEGETGGPRNFNPDSRGGGDGVANGGGSPDGAGPGDVGRQGEQSTIPRPPRVSNSAPNLGGQQNQNQRPPPPPSQQQQAPPPRSRNLPPGKEVILAHFPSKRSNLTLEQFVRKICAYNRKVCPELAHDRREDVIRHNTTLLEGVELPEDVSPLEEADRDTPTDDEKQNTGTVARSTGSSKANKANGNHRGPSSVASQYAGTTSRSSTGVGRGMTPEMQEHLGMNTVAPQRRRKPKGIKLDFKDMAAVKPAIELLMRMNAWANVVCVWLNADVAAGPGFPPLGRNWVLDGRKFLQRCCRIPDVVLSLGWFSTELSATQQYTKTMIDDMLELVQRPFLRGKDSFLYTPAAVAHHITFCVQARFAVKSKPILKQLLELVPSSSLTIYTGFGSIGIAAQDLRAIEENFDTTRLFIDVWKHAEKEQNNKRAARITNGPGGRGGNNQDPNAARGAPDDGRAVTEKCSIM